MKCCKAMITVCESNMVFGPFREEDIFYIEKAPQYTKSLLSNGVKCCEFLLRRGKKLYFIEAKPDCPNRENLTSEDKDRKEKFEKYVSGIVQKMRDSLNLYAAILLNVHSRGSIADNLYIHDLSELNICLVLVCKDAKKEWLTSYSDIFAERLRSEMKIWKIQQFSVMNEEGAISRGFITAESNT